MWLIIYVCTLLLGGSARELKISLHGTDIRELQTDGTVKLIEGDHLLLLCMAESGDATITWRRNSIITSRSEKPELEKIRFEDEGMYNCSSLDNFSGDLIVEQKSVYVKVLYPPTYPFVEVPKSALVDERVSLTCMVDAEPQPTYQWRRDTKDGLLLSRNKTYHFTVPSSSFKIYCIIQNVMATTIGEPKSANVSRTISINVHRKASITATSPNNGYLDTSEGKNIVLTCYISGTPTPKVWWTKSGDGSFHWPGVRLASYNIKTSTSGNYVCHVENTVVAANRSSQTVHKTKAVYVRVLGRKSNNPEPEMKCSDCLANCITVSTFTVTTPVHDNNVKTTSLIPNSTELCQSSAENICKSAMRFDKTFISIVIAAVTGWIVSLVMSVVTVHVCRSKEVKSDDGDTSQPAGITDNHSSDSVPSSAGYAYVNTVRIPEHTYANLPTYDQISLRHGSNIQSVL